VLDQNSLIGPACGVAAAGALVGHRGSQARAQISHILTLLHVRPS
jgi:hypothetical protein